MSHFTRTVSSPLAKTCQNTLKPLLLKLMLEHLRCHVFAPFKRNRWDFITVQANMRFWIARCALVKYQGHSDLGLMVRPWFAEVCRRTWIQATRSWSQHLSRRHQWTLTFRAEKSAVNKPVWLKGSSWCCPSQVWGGNFDTWHDEMVHV